jgi:hypothetical protein
MTGTRETAEKGAAVSGTEAEGCFDRNRDSHEYGEVPKTAAIE